jgi:hypothetical protein
MTFYLACRLAGLGVQKVQSQNIFTDFLINIAIVVALISLLLKPNVMIEWLKLQLRMREVPGSDLGPDIYYPD